MLNAMDTGTKVAIAVVLTVFAIAAIGAVRWLTRRTRTSSSYTR